ncbi:MAG: uracil-DNA glycosylase [Variovorax sp.]|nr:MAG: uracil-DNA glycosylase [Variovorax sp.]
MNALALDARQRAMLEEMGVKVWWPADVAVRAADGAPAIVAEAPAPRTAPVAPVAAPTAEAPARHAATIWTEAPQRLYGGSAAQGGWLIVADMPPEAGGRHGEPFAGDAGRLLDNMLRALQLHTGAVPVHLMRTHRGTVASDSALRPFDDSFAAHVTSVAPRLVLAMGPLAAQSLLERAEPLGKLRGRPAALAALPNAQVVATYHPAYLLRNPADKARAWADLCLAAAQLD